MIKFFYYFWRVGGQKMPFFKNFDIWKMSFLNFLGALKKIAKNGSKRSVTPKLENSLPFEPKKIAFTGHL